MIERNDAAHAAHLGGVGRDSDLATPNQRWVETAFGCSQDGFESLRDGVECPQLAQDRGSGGVPCMDTEISAIH